MKQLLITTHLYTFAVICVIATTISSCTFKKKTDMETPTGTKENELTMLVGTYTSGDSKGIYSFRFNEETGTATALSETEVENPSYLAVSADGKFIYTVSEFNNEQAAANAFAFNQEKGTLKLLNSQKTGGEDPCYIITNGNNVITANYSGGSISVFPIAKDGSLLPASDIIKFEGSGTDKERQEKFLKEGSPSAFKVKAGSGPRHLTFSPNGNYAYLINELSGTVIAFEYKDGDLKEIQTIVADTVCAKGSGDIHISPDGKFLYASNRLKADGIAIFSIQPDNGILTKVGYQLTGIHPRNFIITPNGKYMLVACRDSNVIQIYERDADTGLLTDIHGDIKVDKPVCVKFIPNPKQS